MKKNIIMIMAFIMSNQFLLSADKKIIAVVNNENITKDEIESRMWVNYSNRTLQEMIDETLILQEAKKNGITVDKKVVEERLNNIISNFKDKNEFLKALKTINISENEYKRIIEKQILVNDTVIKLKNINITDEDAKKYFDNNPDQFKRPETVKIRQILVNTKQEADDAYMALQAGANFEKLASLKSIDENLRKSGGDIGYVSKGMLLPEIEKEIFSLKAGEITKPLQVANGFAILKVEEIRPAGNIKFEEVKENLKLALLNQVLNQKKAELINELREKAKVEIK